MLSVVLLGLTGAVLLAAATRRLAYRNYAIIPAVSMLLGLGYLSNHPVSVRQNSYIGYFDPVNREALIVFAIACLVSVIVYFEVDLENLLHNTSLNFLLAILILLGPIWSLTPPVEGQYVNIDLPLLPSFQHGEFVKLFLILALSGLTLSTRTLEIRRNRSIESYIPAATQLSFVTLMTVGFLLLGLGFYRDRGTVFIVLILLLVAVFSYSRYQAFIITAAASMGVIIVTIYYLAGMKSARVDFWFSPFKDGVEGQIPLGLQAIARGGVWGSGIGRYDYSLENIPAVTNDYVIVPIAEQLGMIGVLSIVMLILGLVTIAVRTSFATAPGALRRVSLLSGSLIFLQMTVIVGGVYTVLPLTGQALPFMSKGLSAKALHIFIAYILMYASHTTVLQRKWAGR